MSSEQNNVEVKQANPIAAMFPLLVIIGALIISYTIFYTVFGACENFQNGEALQEDLVAWKASSSKFESEQGEAIAMYKTEYKKWEGEYKAWEKEKRSWERENKGWKDDLKAWKDSKKESEIKMQKWSDDSTKFADENKEAIENWDAEGEDPNPLTEWAATNAKPGKFNQTEPGFATAEPTIALEEPLCPCGEKPKKCNENDPLPGNMFGIIFKGGAIIPLGFTLLLCVIAFSIERAITLRRARGKASVDVFVKKVRMALSDGDIDSAISECDKQQGSVANVVKSGLKKYKEVSSNDGMDKDQKKLAIQTELEEATTLELPMLEKNLVIIATVVSIGVLVGLFGTVLGMIRAFSALATAGAPDASALATGISEALVNTAVGIFNSLLAIVMYNFFTSKIDELTYAIDEAGFSIIQTFDMRVK